ncbi:hypothetical protein BU26DRAFT_33290 [Trematosphaeria pertusa]|uniref:Uncharacterized protein n=1 Tax=Trematosphaeria pertusa TaxID=390896 RepID=A0A6A6J338_9PLEO|nr:uncharacterized protein BU26DRAFT_33290 [Trematosphaeria pertusa]KAF2256988.1 hypothetical protein BU26DRAFT_33290 [Trematosphaeria pertusa]
MSSAFWPISPATLCYAIALQPRLGTNKQHQPRRGSIRISFFSTPPSERVSKNTLSKLGFRRVSEKDRVDPERWVMAFRFPVRLFLAFPAEHDLRNAKGAEDLRLTMRCVCVCVCVCVSVGQSKRLKGLSTADFCTTNSRVRPEHCTAANRQRRPDTDGNLSIVIITLQRHMLTVAHHPPAAVSHCQFGYLASTDRPGIWYRARLKPPSHTTQLHHPAHPPF